MKYLRTYWYDAAVNALPTPEHNALADQRGLKLRLGRMIHGGQKGVDSRIVRDLIVMPRNGAVGTIYLLSGDEDVREGVVEAQELGVSVVLLGIEAPPGKRTQAQTLVREADDHLIVPRSTCERFLLDARPLPSTMAPTVSGGGSIGVAGGIPVAPPAVDAAAFGARFAADWKSKNDAAAVAALIAGRPRIPITIDGPMLRGATAQLGSTLTNADRRAIRAAFWSEIVK